MIPPHTKTIPQPPSPVPASRWGHLFYSFFFRPFSAKNLTRRPRTFTIKSKVFYKKQRFFSLCRPPYPRGGGAGRATTGGRRRDELFLAKAADPGDSKGELRASDRGAGV